VIGALLIVVAMLVVLPFALFAAGAVWSALLGEALTAEARSRAGSAQPAGG
jgi:hypothetical protein